VTAVIDWLVRKWRQRFGYYKVGDHVYTKAELEAALKPLEGLLAERAAQAKRDYEEFMQARLDKNGGEVV
jgi:hypothetical protein